MVFSITALEVYFLAMFEGDKYGTLRSEPIVIGSATRQPDESHPRLEVLTGESAWNEACALVFLLGNQTVGSLDMAVGQNQWYHVGVGAPPILYSLF